MVIGIEELWIFGLALEHKYDESDDYNTMRLTIF